MAQGKEEEFERRALELIERALEAILLLVWLGRLPWFIFDGWHRDPLVRPWRHRRQYADHAGPRPAPRAGLVRSSQLPDEPAVRREHSLVAAGRSPDRRADPRPAPVARRRRGGALGRRDRALVAVSAAALLARAHRAAAARPARLSAGVRDAVLRRVDQRHVHAGADRSSRLAARAAGAEHRGHRGPEACARRADARASRARCRSPSGSR